MWTQRPSISQPKLTQLRWHYKHKHSNNLEQILTSATNSEQPYTRKGFFCNSHITTPAPILNLNRIINMYFQNLLSPIDANSLFRFFPTLPSITVAFSIWLVNDTSVIFNIKFPYYKITSIKRPLTHIHQKTRPQTIYENYFWPFYTFFLNCKYRTIAAS